jgi:hypothetical protein
MMTRGDELQQIADRLAATEAGAVVTQQMVRDIARLGHIMASVMIDIEKLRAQAEIGAMLEKP